MVHFIGKSGTGGTAAPPTSSVSFNPSGGAYAGTSKDVQISVTGATKLRWKINNGAWTTVNATSVIVAVALSPTGKTLYGDALDASSNVLASKLAFYESPGGGQ